MPAPDFKADRGTALFFLPGKVEDLSDRGAVMAEGLEKLEKLVQCLVEDNNGVLYRLNRFV